MAKWLSTFGAILFFGCGAGSIPEDSTFDLSNPQAFDAGADESEIPSSIDMPDRGSELPQHQHEDHPDALGTGLEVLQDLCEIEATTHEEAEEPMQLDDGPTVHFIHPSAQITDIRFPALIEHGTWRVLTGPEARISAIGPLGRPAGVLVERVRDCESRFATSTRLHVHETGTMEVQIQSADAAPFYFAVYLETVGHH